MTVESTTLPGVGRLYAMACAGGRSVGVVHHRDGRRDLIVYDAADRDSAAVDVGLSAAEATRLGELLCADGADVPLVRLDRHGPNLMSVYARIAPGSSWAGRGVAEVTRRVGPDVAIAAVAREPGPVLFIGPEPDVVLRPGDVLVLIGPDAAAFAAVDPLLRP